MFVFVVNFLIVGLNVNAYAATINNKIPERVISEKIEIFLDGTAVHITIYEEPTLSFYSSSGTLRNETYTKRGYKHYAATDKNGDTIWEFTVYGTFEVNPGVSAVCTDASYSVDIADSSWHNTSASAYEFGNNAIGDAEFCKKILFVTIEERTCNIILTCDKNGNLG